MSDIRAFFGGGGGAKGGAGGKKGAGKSAKKEAKKPKKSSPSSKGGWSKEEALSLDDDEEVEEVEEVKKGKSKAKRKVEGGAGEGGRAKKAKKEDGGSKAKKGKEGEEKGKEKAKQAKRKKEKEEDGGSKAKKGKEEGEEKAKQDKKKGKEEGKEKAKQDKKKEKEEEEDEDFVPTKKRGKKRRIVVEEEEEEEEEEEVVEVEKPQPPPAPPSPEKKKEEEEEEEEEEKPEKPEKKTTKKKKPVQPKKKARVVETDPNSFFGAFAAGGGATKETAVAIDDDGDDDFVPDDIEEEEEEDDDDDDDDFEEELEPEPAPEPVPKKKTTAKKKTAAKKKTTAKKKSKKTDIEFTPAPKKAAASPAAAAKPKKVNHFAQKKRQEAQQPPNFGQKDVPTGAPNCLAGLAFVITGLLDSLPRDHAEALIKKYGGRCTGSVSGKTTHLLAGDEPGPSKVSKAKDKKVPIIDEDGLFDLIRTRAGGAAADAASFAAAGKKAKSPAAAAKAAAKAKAKAEAEEREMRRSVAAAAAEAAAASTGAEPLWVDKYKPRSVRDVLGNQACVKAVGRFLDTWEQTFGPGAAAAGGGAKRKAHKALLLSGPPGIGKTTTAVLLCKLRGYECIEMNASDTRSKKTIKQTVEQLTGNRTLGEFWTAGGSSSSSSSAAAAASSSSARTTVNERTVLVMDEVDGIGGNQDRGGLAELVQVIKNSRMPIVCICNDMQNPKMRTLKNYTQQVRYKMAPPEEVATRLQAIARQEGLNIDLPAVSEVVRRTQGDLRQALTIMQMWSNGAGGGAVSFDAASQRMRSAGKDFASTPFDVVPGLFRVPAPDEARTELGRPSWLDKRVNAYFVSSDMVPLMVEDAYLARGMQHVTLRGPDAAPGASHARREAALMEQIAAAADSVSEGDLVSAVMRSESAFSLMPLHAVMSAVKPAWHVAGAAPGARPQFPTWLARYSTRGKNTRQMAAVARAMSADTPATPKAIALEYAPVLRRRLLLPLVRPPGGDEDEGVEEVIALLDAYGLTRDDWDVLVDVGEGFKRNGDIGASSIPSKVKAKFTRAYNKRAHALKVARADRKAAKRAAAKPERMIVDGEEDEDDAAAAEDDEDDEDGAGGGMFAAKKKRKKKAPAKKRKKKSGKSEAE